MNAVTFNKNISDLAKAVTHYAQYQTYCGRDYLLCEHYLAYPIGEFLSSRFRSHAIATEFDHPVFGGDGPGRNRQVDFVLKTRDHDRVQGALELKWIRRHPNENQRIVDDILRLEAFNKHSIVDGSRQGVHRFLLIAGLKETVQNLINARVNNPKHPFLTNVLPVSDNQENIFIYDKLPISIQKLLNTFSTTYDSDIPRQYYARKLADETSSNIRVMIWIIQSQKGVGRFRPSSSQEGQTATG